VGVGGTNVAVGGAGVAAAGVAVAVGPGVPVAAGEGVTLPPVVPQAIDSDAIAQRATARLRGRWLSATDVGPLPAARGA
jgi:hypothetical protein